MQFARNHKAIATIVPFPADHCEGLRGGIRDEGKLSHCRARILHQRERWQTKFFAGHAIDLAHFGRGDDFHASAQVPAISRQLSAISLKQIGTWTKCSRLEEM